MGSSIVRNLGITYISKTRLKFWIKKISKSAPENFLRHVSNWFIQYPWSHGSVRIHWTDGDLISELCRAWKAWAGLNRNLSLKGNPKWIAGWLPRCSKGRRTRRTAALLAPLSTRSPSASLSPSPTRACYTSIFPSFLQCSEARIWLTPCKR